MIEQIYDVIIIGGGAAGLGAAIYAGRLHLKTAVIAEKIGGALMLTDDIENYPGFKKIAGFDLAENLQQHAKTHDIEIIEKKVTKVELCNNKCFKVSLVDKELESKTIIFATGTEWRKLDVPGEKEFANKGVHYCALCDGAMYQNKIIGVVGGSDSAVKEALMLSQYGKKVYLIYRGNNLRAEAINIKKLKENKKIEIIFNTDIIQVKGDKFMKSVIFNKPYNGKTELPVDGLFIHIGRVPLSDLTKDIGVKLNEKQEIIIDRESKTNIPGAFAAGDVVDTKFKQAITGVAEGVTAAYSAYRYIQENK